MANLNKYLGEMNLPDEGFEVIKMIYDFSKDTGTIAAYNGFRAGQKMIVHKCVMKVQTACTSATTAGTVSIGKTGTVDFLAAAVDCTVLIADAIVAGVPSTGGLILAVDDYVFFDIAVEDLTAGKIECTLFVEKFL